MMMKRETLMFICVFHQSEGPEVISEELAKGRKIEELKVAVQF